MEIFSPLNILFGNMSHYGSKIGCDSCYPQIITEYNSFALLVSKNT